uniref:AB hydrolase-1 domain-containing protein n=2 Tax=Chaetoceros debilis TaxID=122233 RepID=A0A7S3V3Z7_9STRA
MGNVNSILFRPPEVTPLHPNNRFFLTNSYGNRIPACFFRRIGASVTLLYSHANAEDLGLMFGWIKCLSRRLNVNVLAFDYTGYGESDGEPCEEACYADIDVAYEYLINVRKIDPSKIVLYGRSVGSGPATYLAAKLSDEGVEIGGLVLEASFKSVYRVVADFGCTVLGDKFPNIDRISSVRYVEYVAIFFNFSFLLHSDQSISSYFPISSRCPTMIIHGADDKTIPIEHGLALHNAIHESYKAEPYWVLGKGHNDLDYNFEPLVNKLNDFLDIYLDDEESGEKRFQAGLAGVSRTSKAAKGMGIEPLRLRTTLSYDN